MTTISTAVAAVVAKLQASPAVSASVERVRLRPWKASVDTAIVVRPVRADAVDPQLMSGGAYAWDSAIAVECYARAAAGTSADAAVDSLLGAAYARLMSDQTLGGAVRSIEPVNVSFDFDVDDQATACAVIQFIARGVPAAPSSL